MLEIAQHFEQVAAWFSPVVLIGSGLVCVAAGLFVWLGGLGFRKVLVAVLGATSGGVCGFIITGQNIILAMVLAAVAAAIAIMFQKIFITVLAAVIAAAFAFVVLAKPYIENVDTLKYYPEYKVQNRQEHLSTRQTIETMKAWMADFSEGIKQACTEMPAYSWVIIAALVVIFIVAGFFFWRLTSALCCATLGTLLVFAGMILLLLYKGAVPVSSICRKQPFFLAVFVAMITFGTIGQLLLCHHIRERVTVKKETNRDKEKPEKTKPDWRTA